MADQRPGCLLRQGASEALDSDYPVAILAVPLQCSALGWIRKRGEWVRELPVEARPGAVPEGQGLCQPLKVMQPEDTSRGSVPHAGKVAASPWVGRSRFLQDSCGTSDLDHTRCSIFQVIAALTGYLSKQSHRVWAS